MVLVVAAKLPGATVITGDVAPALPWSLSTSAKVGVTGAGTLAVDDGSILSSLNVTLGDAVGATGSATITGAGTTWINNSQLDVGKSGSGALSVEAGGLVRSVTTYLGNNWGSTGTATITGPGSTWSNNSQLYVGYSGSGALTVEDGGYVTAGTLYASLSDLHGDGTIVTTTGAVLDADLTFNSANPGQTVLGFGAGGTLTVAVYRGALGAGYKGLGSLTISEGVTITSDGGVLGYNSGSTGTATVSGAGARWNAFTYGSGTLNVGRSGSGALRVEAGGQVRSFYGYLGYDADSTGTATITGPGSNWTTRWELYVGRHGSGALTVEDGGHVKAETLYASLADLHGDGTIEATLGAVLDADLQFEAAHPGQAIVGFGAGGALTVTAAGGVLGAGYKGLGRLTVAEGIAISSSTGYLGYGSGSTGIGTITGAGSTWTNSSRLYVGNSGRGALRVEAGGQVNNSFGYLGYNAGSAGMATITGAGSKWINSSELRVAESGSGALRVESGGQVSNTFGSLGAAGGSTGIATITSAGSQWTNSAFLSVGGFGNGALHVEAGGEVSNTSGSVGGGDGSTGTATITGSGSTWTNSSTLQVGGFGSGAIRVEAGGLVSSASGSVGNSTGSIGTATITGIGSTWTNSSSLLVGGSGSGALRVEAGGHVSDAAGSLGYNAGSTGTATITGLGARWTNSTNLVVGRNGAGSLFVQAGGLVSVRGALTIDFNGGDDSYINMATGGMLALWGDADDSLAQFLGLVAGTDAICYWNAGLANWTPLTAAMLGVDYTLQYQNAGDLNGYTLLTVGTLPTFVAGDFNFDGRVDGADLLAWQRGDSPSPNSSADLAAWRASYGLGATTAAASGVPEPAGIGLLTLATAGLLMGRRSPRPRRRASLEGAAPSP